METMSHFIRDVYVHIRHKTYKINKTIYWIVFRTHRIVFKFSLLVLFMVFFRKQKRVQKRLNKMAKLIDSNDMCLCVCVWRNFLEITIQTLEFSFTVFVTNYSQYTVHKNRSDFSSRKLHNHSQRCFTWQKVDIVQQTFLLNKICI